MLPSEAHHGLHIDVGHAGTRSMIKRLQGSRVRRTNSNPGGVMVRRIGARQGINKKMRNLMEK